MPPESPMSPTPTTYTGQIVRSFLAGTTAWSSIGNPPASDPWLKSYGGMFFAMMNSAGNYVTDMSAVVWGTVPLQSGGDTGTIFYTDFASGTGDYMATSAVAGHHQLRYAGATPGLLLGGALQDRRRRFFRHAAGQHQPAGAGHRYHRHPQRRESWFAMQRLPGSGDSGRFQHGADPDRYIVAELGDFGKASGQPDGPADTQSGRRQREAIPSGSWWPRPPPSPWFRRVSNSPIRRAERFLRRSRSRSPIAEPGPARSPGPPRRAIPG